MTDQEKIQTLIEREYTFYSEELKPYIDAVEVYFGAVPDGLLNEIRKFVGHISSATIDVDDQPQTRVDNINAAHKHLRRILLDCYKLMCIYEQDYIKVFQRKYRFYNTNDVDDGNFDVKLHEKSRRASEAFKDAKKADSTGNNDKLGRKYFLDEDMSEQKSMVDELDAVYEKYCVAYNALCEATTYIDEHYEGVVRVAKKHIMSTFFSVLGWVISIILSIVLFYLGR